MGKNILNKKQKRVLYKNIGVLFALTVLCAVLARCSFFTGGETLQDLAERQNAQAGAPEETSPSPDQPSASKQAAGDALSAPEKELSLSENAEDSAGNQTPQPKNASEPDKNPSARQEEVPAMADRVIYQEGFYYESLSDAIKTRITGISYPADDAEAAISYDTLRYVNVRYYDFNGESQSGELICHKAIAQDLVEIFYELYEIHYPIEKITLIDDYQGDDELSMQDNNTSCFNYRALPSGKLSNHAYGLAIDLNPFYNPYVTNRSDGSVNIAPAGSEEYADREQAFAHKIDTEDPACRLFIQHGFTWGGSWRSVKDYQHFEKEI